MNDEIWKDIKGYEGLYQVSNYGRIKSLARIVIGKNNSIRIVKEKILKLHKDTIGYFDVTLSKNNKIKRILVHRLVTEAFIPNPLSLPEVNHKDGNKQNNYFVNLEWCTKSNNQKHAYKNKLQVRAKGENAANSKLTNTQAEEIRMLKGKISQHKMAEIYNVDDSTISQIILNKKYIQ